MYNFHTWTQFFGPSVEIATQIKSCCDEQNKGTYLKKHSDDTRKVLRDEKYRREKHGNDNTK